LTSPSCVLSLSLSISLHRDLKYENILFVDDSPTAEIKLIDFGLSKQFFSKDQNECNDGVGTMYVMYFYDRVPYHHLFLVIVVFMAHDSSQKNPTHHHVCIGTDTQWHPKY
jgi:hypothetical protein